MIMSYLAWHMPGLGHLWFEIIPSCVCEALHFGASDSSAREERSLEKKNYCYGNLNSLFEYVFVLPAVASLNNALPSVLFCTRNLIIMTGINPSIIIHDRLEEILHSL